MNLMGGLLEKRAGSSLKFCWKADLPQNIGILDGNGCHGGDPKFLGHHGDGGGLCELGTAYPRQAISVIMGANVGTTVTAWILSLTGLDGDNFFVMLLKPTSFTPILALIGVVLTMMAKSDKKKDVGMILLGFAVLMFGMDTMSGAVAGLEEVPEFRNILLMFSNPVLGVLAGAGLTAIIQSSSASVGILQALSATGQVTYGAAIPIIMGQNIGLLRGGDDLSSVGGQQERQAGGCGASPL